MIRILIIDDNPEKLNAVITFLERECSVDRSEIDFALSVNEGRDFLQSNFYDLLLLDLVLPFSDEDIPLADSGVRFLDEIYYNPNINIPIHILGLTEFDEVFEHYSNKFEDKLWGLVNFSLQINDWREKLKSKVFYLQATKKNYRKFIEGENHFQVAIITALNKEFEQLKGICKWDSFSVPDDPLVYYTSVLNTRNSNNIKIIACCINDMGMQSAAAVSSKLMSKFSPELLFMTGICAGIKSTGINLGGLIVAKQVWEYESGKIVDGNSGELDFKPDMKCLTTDQGVITRLTDFSNNKRVLSDIHNEFKGNKPTNMLEVRFDSVGSGPYLLSSKKYLQQLVQNDRKLMGIDMEGYGVYKAGEFNNKTKTILVKGVSDFGDADKDDDYQDYASYVSAKFVYEYLYNCL